tara:strand:+ start:515 stop:1432 length:918 start_codon:yes stop_codon:yes gene_type:complete
MQKKTGNKVLILGGGRWGQITYNNLFNETFIYKLQIISRFLKLTKSILKNKNTKIQKKLNYKEIKDYNLIIICKNNISKLKYLKKLYDFKNILVVEKPLIIKNNINKFLLFFSKKNFFISLPWFFEDNLKKIINNFIDKDDASHIKFIWFDNNQKKYGLSKNYDKNIYYSEDIFSHIFSILYNDKLGSTNLEFLSFNIKNKIEYLSFNYNKIKVEIQCSNKINKNFRKIVLNKNKKIIGQIKILDKYVSVNNNIKNINTRFRKKLNNLTRQYKYLLNQKNIKEFKNLCYYQILYQNHLHKLCKKS